MIPYGFPNRDKVYDRLRHLYGLSRRQVRWAEKRLAAGTPLDEVVEVLARRGSPLR